MRTQRVLERGYGRTIKIPVLNQSKSLGERGSDTLYLAVWFASACSERVAPFKGHMAWRRSQWIS